MTTRPGSSRASSSPPPPATSVPAAMKLVPDRAHVELRPDGDGGHTVVLSFPYDRALVDLCRSIPHRRFDWDRREWSAPATDWAAMKVTEALERFPELDAQPRGARLAGLGRAALDRIGEHRPLRRARLAGAQDARRARARAADRGRGGARRPAPGPADAGGGADAPGAHARRIWTSPPSAACRSSSAAATRRRRGWSTCAAWTARSCAWRCSGTRTSASASPSCRAPRAPDRSRWIRGWPRRSTRSSPATRWRSRARRSRCWSGCWPSTAARPTPSGAHGPRRPSRSPRPPPCSAASPRRFSGRRSATRWMPAARSWPTSRAWARRSRRWPRSRPTAPTPRSSSARRR